MRPEPPALDSPIILKYVEESNPKPLIIADALASFYDGDENDSAKMRKFLDKLRNLTSLGASVVLIHHTGKSDTAQDYRGSSDIKASIDVAFKICKQGAGSKLKQIKTKAFKTRIIVSDSDVFKFDDGCFTRDQQERREPSIIHDQLTKILRDNPNINKGDFEEAAESVGIGRKDTRRFVKDGIADETITVTKGLKNADCLKCAD